MSGQQIGEQEVGVSPTGVAWGESLGCSGLGPLSTNSDQECWSANFTGAPDRMNEEGASGTPSWGPGTRQPVTWGPGARALPSDPRTVFASEWLISPRSGRTSDLPFLATDVRTALSPLVRHTPSKTPPARRRRPASSQS